MPNNTFTSNGTFTPTKNAIFVVECWGGGGGGATYGRTTSAHGAGGAGGGAYAKSTVALISSTGYTVVVGTGGSGGKANNSNGANGSNSHFNNNGVRGAFGLAGNRSGAAGAGGTTANCVYTDTAYAGGAGAANAAMVGGGGGAGGSRNNTGNAASGSTAGVGQNGGGSGTNGGASDTSASDVSSSYGGGGGGAGGNLGTTLRTGGNGGNGVVIVSWNDWIEGSTTGVATNAANLQGKVDPHISGRTDGISTNNVGTLKGRGKLYGLSQGSCATIFSGQTNLVSLYKLDETSGDVIDAHNGYNLSVNGTPTRDVTGKLNKCYTWGGSADALSVDRAAHRPTDVISVGCWFKTNNTGVYQSLVMYYGYGALCDLGWDMCVNNESGIEFAVRDDNTPGDLGVFMSEPSLGVTDGNWHFVVGTFDGTYVRLYVDGVMLIRRYSSNYYQLWANTIEYDTTNPLRIGSRNGAQYFPDELDEVFVAHAAFTQAEITELYNSGSGKAYPWTTPGVSGTLAAKAAGGIQGVINGVASNASILHGHGRLYGATNGVGSNLANLGTLGGISNIFGSTTGVGSNAGDIHGHGKLYGATNGVGSNAGVLHGHGALLGTIYSGEIRDNFDSYSAGDIEGANWANLKTYKVRIVDVGGDKRFYATPGGSGKALAINNNTFRIDHSSQIVVDGVSGASTYIGVLVRGYIDSSECGYIYIGSSTIRYLIRIINGSETELGSAGAGVTAGDILRLDIQGSVLSCYINGVLDTALSGGTGIFIDSSLTSGKPGIVATEPTAYGDLWRGAEILVLGVIHAHGKLYGSTTGTGSNAGDLKAKSSNALIGSTTGVASNSTILHGHGKLYGSTTGVGSNSGFFAKTRISGSTNGVGSNAGKFAKTRIAGATTGVATISGTVNSGVTKSYISGTTTGVGSNSARLQRVYYVRVSGEGGSNSNSGTAASPWLTLYYASTQVTSTNSIIDIGNGTFIETSQSTIAVGVSLRGKGNTSIIHSHHTGDYSYLLSLDSGSEGTDGNQRISKLRFEGNATGCWGAIYIAARKNIEVDNCEFADFFQTAVAFNGKTAMYDPGAPTTYATGNSFHDNIVDNCSNYYTSNYDSGQLEIGGQDGMLVYNNTMTQNTRTSHNGYIIKAYNECFGRGIKIYNNTMVKAPPMATDSMDWNFAIEMWFPKGGIEIYNNHIEGSIDILQSEKNAYAFSMDIHHNTIGYSSMQAYNYAATNGGIFIDESFDTVRIHHNLIQHTGSPFQFYPEPGLTCTGLYIYSNIVNGCGATDSSWSQLMSFSLSIDAGSGTTHCDYWEIINNTFYSADNVLADDGMQLPCDPNNTGFAIEATNIKVQNNIFIGYGYNPIYHQLRANQTLDYLWIEHNVFYNNGTNAVAQRGTAPTNVTADSPIVDNPDFVTEGSDFRILAVSPAKDAGMYVSTVLIDYDDDPFVNPPSIGAQEYESLGLIGVIAGIGSNAGVIHGHGKLYGSTTGIGSNVAYLREQGSNKLIGSSTGIASNVALLLAKGKLYGSTTGTGTNAGKLRSLYGTINGVGSNNAVLHAHGKLYGTINGIGSDAGNLLADGKLYGGSTGVGSNAGIIHGHGKLYGSLTGVALLGGVLGGKADCNGIILTYSQVVGNCTDKPIPGQAKGVINGVGSTSAMMQKYYAEVGEILDGISLITLLLDQNSTIKNVLDEDSIIKERIEETSLIL